MKPRLRAAALPLIWAAATVAASGYFVASYRADERARFLPGRTTDGHYQIELKCDACHTPFMGVNQGACVKCHGEELREASDSHPEAKFADPRNAERSKRLDARRCVTCHTEHRPEQTGAMGFTLPADACRVCHFDIAEIRPSHAKAEFAGCSTAGCHNFHDNRALYEDFLLKHRDDPEVMPNPVVPKRDLLAVFRKMRELPAEPLEEQEADAPMAKRDGAIVREWLASGHSAGRVNCSDCHDGGSTGRPWRDQVTLDACKACHPNQAKGFFLGRHGMRIEQGLPPVSPAMARLPMRAEAASRQLDCQACHPAHRDDTRAAAVDACIKCHNDPHTLAYEASPHGKLWRAELSGEGEPGSGVSCATCHLPRLRAESPEGASHIAAQHNQNANLRPNDKMAREVCLNCHGLGFALDALADRRSIDSNFSDKPPHTVESIAWAVMHSEETTKEKARQTAEK